MTYSAAKVDKAADDLAGVVAQLLQFRAGVKAGAYDPSGERPIIAALRVCLSRYRKARDES